MATVVPTVGRSFIAELFATWLNTFGNGWFNVGTGSGTSAETDTDLFDEVSVARSPVGAIQQAPDPPNYQLYIFGTYFAADFETITNIGIFSTETGPSLILKHDVTPVAMAPGDYVDLTWTIRFM